MVTHGIIFSEESLGSPPAPTSVIKVGLAGEIGIMGGPTGVVGQLFRCINLTQVLALAGSDSLLYEVCRHIYAVRTVEVVLSFAANGADDAMMSAALDRLRTAKDWVNVKPNIVAAPGKTYIVTTNVPQEDASGVFTSLANLAKFLGALGVADAAPTDIAVAAGWEGNNNDEDVMSVFGDINTYGISTGEVPGCAGAIAALCAIPVRRNPSNIPADSLTSVRVPVSFSFLQASDAASLDDTFLSCFVRQDAGFVLWGGRTRTSDVADPLRFINRRRILREVQERIIVGAQAEVDDNLTDDLLERIVSKGNEIVSGYVGRGDIRAGLVRVDSIDVDTDDFLPMIVALQFWGVNRLTSYKFQVSTSAIS